MENMKQQNIIGNNRVKLPFSSFLKLNLGCGFREEKGWVGLDKGDYGQSIVWDMREGILLPDNSCKIIKSEDVLEHIQINEDFIFIMNECLRVLKSGGEFHIGVPYYTSNAAFKDPTHCRFFNESTFTYLLKDNKWEYGFDKRWKIKKNEVRDDRYLEVILIADK